MELTWMGRYRELVRTLIHYSNCSNHSRSSTMEAVQDGIALTKHEYQVLEYVLEFEDDQKIQADISRDLGILPCTLTNVIKRLLSLKLIERFRIQGNRKNIVLRPTPLGRSVYHDYCTRDIQRLFVPFFQALDGLSEEALEQLASSVQVLSQRWDDFGDSLLVKLEPGEKD